MKRGKKYIEAAKLIERGNLYEKEEAVALVKKAATAKFDETIEAHIRTGCDGRHADPIGKASFTEEQLADNFQTLIDAINKARPSAVKGQYLKSITLTSTMGPGVKVNPMKLA